MQYVEGAIWTEDSDIDAESGTIRNVRLNARHSENNREYPPETQRRFAHLYDGVKVYLEHDRNRLRNRKFEDWVAYVADPRYDEHTETTRGDLVLLEGVHKSKILDAAKKAKARKFKKGIGLSHVADGSHSYEAGKEIVHTLTEIISVDMLTNAATGDGGLFEENEMAAQQPTNEPTKQTIKAIMESAPEKTPLRQLLFEAEEMGMVAPEAEVEVAPEASPEEKVKEGLIAAIVAKLEGATPEELQAVMEVFGLEDSLSATGNGGGEAEEAVTEEVQQLRDKLVWMEAKADVVEAGLEPTSEQIKAVSALSGPERKRYFEQTQAQKGETTRETTRSPMPEYSRPRYEEQSGDNGYSERLKKRIAKAEETLASRQR